MMLNGPVPLRLASPLCKLRPNDSRPGPLEISPARFARPGRGLWPPGAFVRDSVQYQANRSAAWLASDPEPHLPGLSGKRKSRLCRKDW